MRRVYSSLAFAMLLAPGIVAAQAGEQSQAVKDGGIKIAGWSGRIDASEAAKGLKLTDASLAAMGKDLHVRTGPQVAYWNKDAKATGNYTVKATFTEPKFQSLNDHPHPYGIMIGGNDLDTENATYLYCAAYGTGTYIMRGFGPAPFSVSARRPEANAAINKAAGVGQPVKQEIAVSVKDDKISCSVNGTVVGTWDKAAAVGAGKAKSTDGFYGVRFGHNTEAMVSGLSLSGSGAVRVRPTGER